MAKRKPSLILERKESKSVAVSFRFRPSTVRQLEEIAKKKNLSQTEVVESLIALSHEQNIKSK